MGFLDQPLNILQQNQSLIFHQSCTHLRERERERERERVSEKSESTTRICCFSFTVRYPFLPNHFLCNAFLFLANSLTHILPWQHIMSTITVCTTLLLSVYLKNLSTAITPEIFSQICNTPSK